MKKDLLHLYRQTKTDFEYCFNIETSAPLTSEETKILYWLLAETFEPQAFGPKPFLSGKGIKEIGPNLHATTPFSTNAVAICHACGLTKIKRIERSRRYTTADIIHDRMTEEIYDKPLSSFDTGAKPEPVKTIPVLEQGLKAFRRINKAMGLGMDKWDIKYYTDMFTKDLKRNPKDVECFQLGQGNSEHCRHWFFLALIVINGVEMPRTLFEIVKAPLKAIPGGGNSIIAFHDNASAIRGYEVMTLVPEQPGKPSRFIATRILFHFTFTAETHNFPTGVAPFPGAETGTGGRIRDVKAIGIGGLMIAGTIGYSVGNLLIPGYKLPWEDPEAIHPDNLATPLRILIEASNGASDYGNKIGEPVIAGTTRTFDQRLPNGERRAYLKPILFTGGIGQIDDRHIEKKEPQKGMLVVQIGGPAYRIGFGGGGASSLNQGQNKAKLDFNAVQRGDAEMEQKTNRVITACVEMGGNNPIANIHDQGSGGPSNVVTEIVHPAGAKIRVRKINVGDRTMSVVEIWGSEYQERYALLIFIDRIDEFQEICAREQVPCEILGEITGDGKITLVDEKDVAAVCLGLDKILGQMPQKTFFFTTEEVVLPPLTLPKNLTVREALDLVLRLPAVGSKRFLTNKVDRSVTGLIVRQQCVGPLHLPLSDVAVVAQSHFGLTGAATAIGEQPIKGLINPAAMARMTVTESLTNLVWAKIPQLPDVRCSANWMWAAKQPGEGPRIYEAAEAMSDFMIQLREAVDGGKDSLTMATVNVRKKDGSTETVKAPGTLVISAYAPCPDITKVVTPDFKVPGLSHLMYIDLGQGKYRLGGSALAQVHGQIGNESPDIHNPKFLVNTFYAIQELIDRGLILSGHDISDGGLITTILEMAFAGNCGVDIKIKSNRREPSIIRKLFSEEAGMVMEFLPKRYRVISEILNRWHVPSSLIGRTQHSKNIHISCGDKTVLNEGMPILRNIWEATSYQLEKLQANPACADEERTNVYRPRNPLYHCNFTPRATPKTIIAAESKPQVAIIRAEGSNGDREMISAFYQAGFEPRDINMTDLMNGQANLKQFQGVAFVGGFSYADALDSSKGWAGIIRYNEKVKAMFSEFYHRPDTFSLGICNGCQLMALLGWVPWEGIADELQPRFIHNRSGRFESRFPAVTILKSPAIMFKGMEGSILGVWSAHGEGRFHTASTEVYERIIKSNLAPIRYADHQGNITEKYPFNPNGSPDGIAALCSPDGRHLAMMPHPERTFLKWQWPWMPAKMKKELRVSPWLQMFRNAYRWCQSTM